MAQDWKFIAKLRRAEGDEEGAKRAERNAGAYVGRNYLPGEVRLVDGGFEYGLRTVWRTHTRQIARPSPYR